MSPLKTLVMTSTVAALLGLTVAPAHAQSETSTDARGDVVDAEGGVTSDAADRRRADILSLRGEHRDGRLRFTFTMADTSSFRGPAVYLARARFVTPAGADYTAALERLARGGERMTLRLDGELVRCRGLEGVVKPAKDRYVLTVPRSCADNPRSVLFGGELVYLTWTDHYLVDDARADGEFGDQPLLGAEALRNN